MSISNIIWKIVIGMLMILALAVLLDKGGNLLFWESLLQSPFAFFGGLYDAHGTLGDFPAGSFKAKFFYTFFILVKLLVYSFLSMAFIGKKGLSGCLPFIVVIVLVIGLVTRSDINLPEIELWLAVIFALVNSFLFLRRFLLFFKNNNDVPLSDMLWMFPGAIVIGVICVSIDSYITQFGKEWLAMVVG